MRRSSTPNRPEAPLNSRRRNLILITASMGFLLAGLDSTALNIALPDIQRSLGSSPAQAQWIVSGYTLVLASVLLLVGSLADRFGRRRVFQLGQALFTVGSLLCAVSPTVEVLILARLVQALGGAMLNPVANSIVRHTFHEPGPRARAFGIMAATAGISMALGPVLGGVLVDLVSWRAIFFINLPIGILAIVLTAVYIPVLREGRARKFDPVGQFLVVAALATLTAGIIEGGSVGYETPWVIALLVASVVCLVALVLYELRHPEPLLEMRFFASIPFSGAIVIAFSLAAVNGGFLFINTFYLQQARGLSAIDAALYLLPLAVAMAVFAPISGRLAARFGGRPSVTAGGLAVAIGGLMLTFLTAATPVLYLFAAYVILGIGFALITPPITNVAVTVMPSAQSGVAAAVTTTSRQSGLTLGVAIFGVIAGSAISTHVDPSYALDTRPIWWVIVAVGLVIVIIDRVVNMRWAWRTAERTAELLGGELPHELASRPAPSREEAESAAVRGSGNG